MKRQAIKQVKYRYLRRSTQTLGRLRRHLTEDIIGDYGSSLGEEHHFTNRKDLVDFMRKVHAGRGTDRAPGDHPEISVDGDEAEAIWYLRDRVIVQVQFHARGAPPSTATAIARRRTAGRSARPDTTAPTVTMSTGP